MNMTQNVNCPFAVLTTSKTPGAQAPNQIQRPGAFREIKTNFTMKTFETIIAEINAILTAEQIQLLKDTINMGCWGDCDMTFKNENGEFVTSYCVGYITNDAKNAGHFSGRKCSAMFRSIYKRLGMLGNGQGCNEYFAYFNNWWGDGSGDVFFIRSTREENALDVQFERWARS